MRRGLGQSRFGTRLFGTIASAGVLVVALSGSAFVTRASVSNGGAPANYATPTYTDASISDDGRYVAFDSGAVLQLETNETFTVRLSLPTGARINRATGTGTILDDG
jgi:hypothetical protein